MPFRAPAEISISLIRDIQLFVRSVIKASKKSSVPAHYHASDSLFCCALPWPNLHRVYVDFSREELDRFDEY